MTPLTTEQILAAGKKSAAKVKPVRVPEFDSEGIEAWLHIRKMRARERDLYDASLRDDDNKIIRDMWRVKHVACVLCQEDGTPLFDVSQLDETSKAIGEWDGDVVARLFLESRDFNNLDAEGAAKGKGDSGAEAGGSSSSGSPSPAAAPTLTDGSTASPPG